MTCCDIMKTTCASPEPKLSIMTTTCVSPNLKISDEIAKMEIPVDSRKDMFLKTIGVT